MRSPRALLFQLQNAIVLVGLCALWILFCPRQFGGPVSYVIVHGISMLPRFHEGDLVIVRQTDDYQIGDIVTYQYPGIGPVIHRVIGKAQQRFQIKGDNNAWVDGYQPTKTEIYGAYWFSFPGVGRWVAAFRSPWLFGLLAGLGTLLIGLSFEMDVEKKPKLRFAKQTLPADGWLVSQRETIVTVAIVLAMGFGLLLIIGLLQPASRAIPLEIPIRQTARYDYGATLPPGIYDDNHLGSGGAIFPQAGCTVQLLLDYHLMVDAAHPVDKVHEVTGTHQLAAKIQDGKGWERSLPLEPETGFQGADFQASGKVDFCAAQTMIETLQAATGARNLQYQLVVVPNIRVQGRLDGYAFQEAYNPRLVFALDPYQVYLLKDEQENPLENQQTAIVKAQALTGNSLSLWLVTLPVMTARWIGLIGLILCTGLFVALYILVPQPAGICAQVARLTRRPLVAVLPGSLPKLPLIQVCKIEDLAVLLGEQDLPVLYYVEDGQYTFLLQTGQALYAYAVHENQPA